MSPERMKTEEFWNPEHIVEKFWNGLKDGVIYGRKCKECGAGVLNARLELEDRGLKYVCGEVQLDEGPAINAVILGVNKKKAREIDGKLPVRVRPVFYDMGRYTTLFFELDE